MAWNPFRGRQPVELVPAAPEPGTTDAWLLDGSWLTFNSTNVDSARYAYDSMELEVLFSGPSRPSGSEYYTFHNVPPQVARELAEASSPGRYFWNNIRDRYQYVRHTALSQPADTRSRVIRTRPDLE